MTPDLVKQYLDVFRSMGVTSGKVVINGGELVVAFEPQMVPMPEPRVESDWTPTNTNSPLELDHEFEP